MDSSVKFSLSRLANVAIHDFKTDLRRNIYMPLILFGTMFLILVLLLLFKSNSDFDGIAAGFAGGASLIIMWGSFYASCEIMRPMRNKAGRLSYLMLPATQAEKFVSRLLFVTVGYLVLAFVALLAVEIAYQLIVVVFQFDIPKGSLLIYMFKHLSIFPIVNGGTMHYPALATLWLLAASLQNCSMWVFGGCLFFSHSFGKTVVMQLLVGMVLSIALVVIVKTVSLDAISHYLNNMGADLFFGIFTAVMLVLAVLFFWWSYRLFVNAQVISRYKLFLK